MNQFFKSFTVTAVWLSALFITPLSYADFYLTPWVGYTGGGAVIDQDDVEYDLKNSESFAFTFESTLDKGRIGLFYSNQNSQIETLNEKSTIQYLHFQSSIYYPVRDKVKTYVGVGLGASYVDVDWASDKYGFSASMFGGIEYDINDTISLNSQLRWLGTVVDNETTGICNLPTDESCVIRFKTDWMNQFSANIGLVVRF
ncbi:porin family protein [Vibrio sp. ZSDE26]|uniref:Porin family protein n=2 Tax=Vibrio amylolyticus TaxID=2847292 RepID=A0A9X2BGP3_9VIBR|nr:porin family protein [Vibrio amylolyticus]MCK6262085.1 porin family protein [Vibrio amylolyticus]